MFDDSIAVEQAVAAGNQYVAEFGMAADIGNHLIGMGQNFFFGQADEPFAKAVAAVHGAEIGGEQQRSLGIFMLQPAHFGVALFAGGIEAAVGEHFPAAGHGHFANGIIGIVGIDEGKVVAGYGHRIALDNGIHPALFFFAEGQILCQLLCGGYVLG